MLLCKEQNNKPSICIQQAPHSKCLHLNFMWAMCAYCYSNSGHISVPWRQIIKSKWIFSLCISWMWLSHHIKKKKKNPSAQLLKKNATCIRREAVIYCNYTGRSFFSAFWRILFSSNHFRICNRAKIITSVAHVLGLLGQLHSEVQDQTKILKIYIFFSSLMCRTPFV